MPRPPGDPPAIADSETPVPGPIAGPDPAAAPDAGGSRHWHDATDVRSLERARIMRVELTGEPIALIWHDGRPWALDDVCVHRQRSLAEGTLFQGRLICPGHQWAFALDTGLCKERDRCQPVHPTRVDRGRVMVALPV